MFEFRNVLDVTYGAYVVKGAYRGVGTSGGNAAAAPERDQAVALIRELLRGRTAAVRQSTRDASTAVSIVQTFAGAIDTIAEKLGQMKELAGKAPSPDYSRPQVEQMQEQFESLAKQINQTAESTEYNYNKLFTADGKAVSISIGDGSKVDIFARDFTFDAQGMNIAIDPEGALSKVKHAVANLSEYKEYLSRQVARVEGATALLESEMESSLGVDLSDFSSEVAVKTASRAANQLLKDRAGSLDTQANSKPRRALQLLKGRKQQAGLERSNRQSGAAGERARRGRPFQGDSHS